jgi:hypothetical protein
MIDPKLREFCTVRQLEILEAIEKHGSERKAAKALSVSHGTVGNAMVALKRKAALQGYSPDHDMRRTVPDGFKVKGVSTFYDRDGKPAGQWVKSSADAERQAAMMREAIAALSEEVKGLAPVTKAPAYSDADLLAVYPSGDPHWGMLSWAEETGENFDLEIARNLAFGAIDRLIASAPNADTAVFLPLGDVLHMNDQTNVTPGHKHQLDADGRFLKVLRVSIEAYRHAILRCLEKHQRVVVRFLAGNHDPQAVWALAFAISAYFDKEPRVEVDLSPSKHWFFRFGKVLIGATHGDTVKPEALLGVMAADRAEDWGQTKFRYWYTGHVHHQSVREYPGVVCESFRTLAAKDAYAAAYGYRAGRDMRCIVHHKDFGEVERHRCDVAMLAGGCDVRCD